MKVHLWRHRVVNKTVAYSTYFLLHCVSGRCVRSFSVRVINSTCVSLWWTLLDNSLAPLFMVVQWSPQRQQDPDHHKVQSGDTWARLPYTDRPTYLRGNNMASLHFPIYFHP